MAQKKKSSFPASTIIIIFSSITFAAALIFFGFWLGQNPQIFKKVPPAPPTPAQINEVPYGDENQDTDAQYQEAMNNLTYRNETFGFSFIYPTSVYLQEGTDVARQPLLFVDTQPIVIPEVYGGPLTPVEISVPPLVPYKNTAEAITSFKRNNYKNSYQEKNLPANLGGIWMNGKMQGFLDGTQNELLLLEGKNGLIQISFFHNEKFSQELFDKIITSFKLF